MSEVISYGGSIIAPEKIDISFNKKSGKNIKRRKKRKCSSSWAAEL
jgi:hypothetical protein